MAKSTSRTPTRRKYKRNYLKQVIARIDFAQELPDLAKGAPSRFQSWAKYRFPLYEPKKQVLAQFAVTGVGFQQSKTERTEWSFHSRDKSKLVYVGNSYLYVEYSKYKHYEILKEDFVGAVNALFDSIDGLQGKRLGLRYIDNITFPHEPKPTDWRKYLDPDLLSSFNLADDVRTISRTFHVLEFNYGDMGMRFQYGMPNPDFPAVIKQKLFALDYDAYSDQSLGRDEVPKMLDRFHDKINASFEQVIKNGLRNKMGVING